MVKNRPSCVFIWILFWGIVAGHPILSAAVPEDRAAQAKAVAGAFRELGLDPRISDNGAVPMSDNYFSIVASRSASNPALNESHQAFIMKDPAYVPDPFSGGARKIDLEGIPAGLLGSGSTPGQVSAGQMTYAAVNSVVVRFTCGTLSVALNFYSEAQLSNKDEGMAQAETANRQIRLEQSAESIARRLVQALQKGKACEAPAGFLSVGIGGEYEEAAKRVRVTAGVENRPGVGLGDDYYEWTLDGAPLKKGIELKSIVHDASGLLPGKHVLTVTVTDKVNKNKGSASFTFEVKGVPDKPAAPPRPPVAPPVAKPPVVKPPADFSGAKGQLTASDGSKINFNVGGKTQLNWPPGVKGSVKVLCEGILLELMKIQISGLYVPDDQLRARASLFVLALTRLNCFDLADSFRGFPKALDFPAGPAVQEDEETIAAAQLGIELRDGTLQMETVNERTAVSVETDTATATAFGAAFINVAFDPGKKAFLIKVGNGLIGVRPKNPSLPSFELLPGEAAEVTMDNVRVFADGGLPASPVS